MKRGAGADDKPNRKRAIVFAGGDLLYEGGLRNLLEGPWDFVACADSGARHALRLGMAPTALIGDMDSIDPADRKALPAATAVTFPTDKDKTDTQLAVEWALARGAGYVVIAGGIGSRFDHSLANAHLLGLLHRAGAAGAVTDGRQSVYLLVDELTLDAPAGYVLSVLPLTSPCRGLVLQGLRWELTGYDMELGDSRTVSNEFTGRPAKLGLASGKALVVVSAPEA